MEQIYLLENGLYVDFWALLVELMLLLVPGKDEIVGGLAEFRNFRESLHALLSLLSVLVSDIGHIGVESGSVNQSERNDLAKSCKDTPDCELLILHTTILESLFSKRHR